MRYIAEVFVNQRRIGLGRQSYVISANPTSSMDTLYTTPSPTRDFRAREGLCLCACVSRPGACALVVGRTATGHFPRRRWGYQQQCSQCSGYSTLCHCVSWCSNISLCPASGPTTRSILLSTRVIVVRRSISLSSSHSAANE